jgi:flagellin-specific chaperone FliS
MKNILITDAGGFIGSHLTELYTYIGSRFIQHLITVTGMAVYVPDGYEEVVDDYQI